MPSVFINYRRADSGASAGRLTDDLKEQLRGVRRVYLMPRGVMALLRRAWLETRAGLSGSDGTFSRLQASMEQFEDAAARPIASAYGL